ncbi:MAG: DNA repair protein RadA [Candidatus Gracilibacteria bacterium]|nr:DNA repair protein RadA [Candidatus Gracilibacteria bacterium]
MYQCKECGAKSVNLTGKCFVCGEFGSLEKIIEEKSSTAGNKIYGTSQKLNKIDLTKKESEIKYKTSSSELNNVLGGGVVPGSLVLLSGEPGIGKSTLTLQISDFIKNKNFIYVSGEETTSQISNRSERLKIKGDNLSLLSETNFENIMSTLKDNPCDIVILDSISVISSNNITSASGSINQIKYITDVLLDFSKTTNTAIFIIGHVTKDGNLAGPKALEHMVDTVLYFEGDRFENIRILRGVKNRFGATNEVGIFKMTDKGLIDVPNPGLEFISKDSEATIGSALSITLEGSRALIVECESLTTYTKFGYPKRSARGLISSKLDMLIAVLGKYTKIKLDSSDVYSNIARGLHIKDPAIDLAIIASLISSKTNFAMPRNAIFIGEISLTGKIKNVFNIEERISQAEKLGFENIYIPNIKLAKKHKINIIKLNNIVDLINQLS